MPDLRINPLGCSCRNLAQTAEAMGLTIQALEIGQEGLTTFSCPNGAEFRYTMKGIFSDRKK